MPNPDESQSRARVGRVLGSVQRPGMRLNVHWCLGDLEVMLLELAGGKSLSDPSLYQVASWHLVLEGQARFEIGERTWDLLPEESFSLDRPGAFSLVNPARDRLRVLSVVPTHREEMPT